MAVPVTILCGALGAGKTTLLSQLLEQDDREIAVVVNDVGEVNVDADLVETRTDLETGEEVVALENGCICCSLGGDLSRAVVNLWKRHDFDALVVEASGVGEPEPIAHQFVRGPAGGPYDLDAIVTVVNARQFSDTFLADGTSEPPTQSEPDEAGTRPLSDLLLEQIEFCDLLVVNKCDLVSETELGAVVDALEALQPRAAIHTTSYGDLAVDTVLDTGLFDFSVAREAAGWKRAIDGDNGHSFYEHDHDDSDNDPDDDDDHDHGLHHQDDHDHDHDGHDHARDHVHPLERYGIVVDTYHRVRPFHPERLVEFLEHPPDGLIRMKGLTWVAGREEQAITMSLAATETSLEVTGRWIASFSAQQQETYRASQPDLPWDDIWGDRETRLAVIGHDLELDPLFDRLDECLVTDAELEAGPERWSTFENPTPTAMNRTVVVSSAERECW
ncbi:CobW family GTP-binding protein [Natrialbaceae archaeon A-CW1-1]